MLGLDKHISNISRRMLTLYFLVHFLEGILSLTITTSPEISITLGPNSSFVLNCTFEYDSTEVVTTVYWRKKLPGTDYTGLAKFNYNSAIYEEHGLSIEARSNLQTFNAISNSTILNITDVRCEDVGQYQCEVEFSVNTKGKRVNESTDVYIKANAEKPTIFSDNPKNSLEEHEILEITCRAEVGGPYGSLEIWKFNLSSNNKTLLKNTSEVYRNTKNCTSVANLTMTYNLSRQDNGIEFRCTSRNKFTEEPAPNSEIGPIEVLYGPSNTRINSFNLNAHSSIGDSIILKCTSDGHPNPNYTWKFNNTKLRNNSKFHISANQSRLSFTVTNISDSGLYKCVAYNEFKGNMYNSSSNVTITVQEEVSLEMEKTCSENSCLFLQHCILRNGSAICSVNIWVVLSILFIFLTLVFGSITIGLLISRATYGKRSNHRKKLDIETVNCSGFNTDDIHVSYTRSNFEDFGGYADPKDVKRPENGQKKSDRDGRDNPYADPVDFQTKYAVVQKNWETPANSPSDTKSSNPSDLLNNMDTSNTGNPSSTEETLNPPKNSSNEKTPSSTETSDTIPKPPNVSQSSTNYINLLLE